MESEKILKPLETSLFLKSSQEFRHTLSIFWGQSNILTLDLVYIQKKMETNFMNVEIGKKTLFFK